MNQAAILSLIGDLYTQIEVLQGENETLRKPEPGEKEPQFDPLGGTEEAIAQARKEAEA
jgi:hypothetical protein